MKRSYLFIFTVLAITELAMVLWYPSGRWLTKPLIMISLTYFYYHSSQNRNKLFLAALVFALLGDVFLLFDLPNFFLFGLGSFLIMQVLYTIVFLRQRTGPTNRKALMTMVVSLSAMGLTAYQIPHLGAMKIPVIIYVLAILAMALSAIWRDNNLQGYFLVILGVVLFMISDSLISITKFVQPVLHGGFLIMSTYILAQLCIVEGFLRYEKD